MAESASNTASKKLIQIDVSSDTVCPWCFVGKKNLDKAIDASLDQYNFEIRWHPYFLDASAPKEGVNKKEFYRRKFGSRVEGMFTRMSEIFGGIGLEYDISGLTGNTLDSHRLIHYTGKHAPDKQHSLVEELCLGYFTQGKFIGDREFLVVTAKKLGIEGAEGFLSEPNNGVTEGEGEGGGPRKSKRLKSDPIGLQDYHCAFKAITKPNTGQFVLLGSDPEVNYAAKYAVLLEKLKKYRTLKIGDGITLTNQNISEIAGRTKLMLPKVVDALMYFTRLVSMRLWPSFSRFFDSRFPAMIMRHHSRFKKLATKDKHRFVMPEEFLGQLGTADELDLPIQKVYFPFFVDQKHWIAVCVDIPACSIYILDCNTCYYSDNFLKKDLAPIAMMLPLITMALGVAPQDCVGKPYHVERVKGIPHNSDGLDSAVTTVLFIQAHAMTGFDGCMAITPEVVPIESQKLAVLIFEEFVEPI